MSIEPVRERWLSFLEKIAGRLRELLEQSAAALPPLLDLSDFDVTPFQNALTAVHSQSAA